MRRLLYAALFSVSQLLPARVFAGPPYVTDDPEPVDLGHTEFYLASIYNHSQGGGNGPLPYFELNYGAFPDVHLHLATPSAYSHEKGAHAQYGYGDTEIGFKYRFLHEGEDFPQAATFPQLNFPTGDEKKGLGNGDAQLFLPLWLQKSFHEWTLFGGGGWWYNPGTNHENFARVGSVLSREMTDSVSLGLELFSESKQTNTGESHTAFNVGSEVQLSKGLNFLLSLGRDVDGPNQFSSYLGLQYVR
jgi:hypothetical protein